MAGFDLLRQPVKLAALPLSERVQVRKALGDRPARGLRAGEVRFTKGKVRAVGNHAVVCLFAGIESYGAGACLPRRSVAKRGISFVALCAGSSKDRARITGIVPNGIIGVHLRREDNGSIFHRARIVSNVFTMIVSPFESTLSWVGLRSDVEVRYPLAELTAESECTTHSEES